MSNEALTAEKLAGYRALIDDAARALEPAFEIPNGGSNLEQAQAIKQSLTGAVRAVAEDFAAEFNRKLGTAARTDASVELVASNYEMTPEHVDELAQALAEPLQPVLAPLDAGDLARARGAIAEALPRFERRLRTKWQAYFVMTFQDLSVERKAARDRRRLQPRVTVAAGGEGAPVDDAALRRLPDLVPTVGAARTQRRSPWLAVIALLALAALSALLLVRHAAATASPATPSGRR